MNKVENELKELDELENRIKDAWLMLKGSNVSVSQGMELAEQINSIRADHDRIKQRVTRDILEEYGLLDRRILMQLADQLEYEEYFSSPFPA